MDRQTDRRTDGRTDITDGQAHTETADQQTDRKWKKRFADRAHLDDFWCYILWGAADSSHGRLCCLLSQPKVGYLDLVNVVGRRQQQIFQFEVTVDDTSAYQDQVS